MPVDIAINDGGIAYCLKDRVRDLLEAGVLSEVLQLWASEGEAFHIYYSSRRQQPGRYGALSLC